MHRKTVRVLLAELGALVDVDAAESADAGEESLEDSWGVMRSWWMGEGSKLRAIESGVGGTLLCEIEELHGILVGVMARKAGGKSASEEEERNIYALSLTIIVKEAAMKRGKRTFGVGFLHYMVALRNVHSITYDHLHPAG